MYEVVQHTADLRLRVRASSVEDLFRESLRGMTDCMRADEIDSTSNVERNIRLESADRTSLLVDFLNEVLWLAHVQHEIFDAVEFGELSETRIEARLRGRRAGTMGEDIKAVTYHEADVRQNPAGEWETTLVFDL